MTKSGRFLFAIGMAAAGIAVMAPAVLAAQDDTDWFLYEELNDDNTFAVTADEAFEAGALFEAASAERPEEAAVVTADSEDLDRVFGSAAAAEETGYTFEIGKRDRFSLEDVISEAGIPEEFGSAEQVNVAEEAMSDVIRVEWENDDCIITPTQNFRQVTVTVVLGEGTCEVDLDNAYCTAEDTSLITETAGRGAKQGQTSLSAKVGQEVKCVDPKALENGMTMIRDNNV